MFTGFWVYSDVEVTYGTVYGVCQLPSVRLHCKVMHNFNMLLLTVTITSILLRSNNGHLVMAHRRHLSHQNYQICSQNSDFRGVFRD